MPEICVTGMGVISAIGMNVAENLDALIAQKTGIQTVKYLQTIHRNSLLGEVKADNKELAEMAGIAVDELYERTTLLGMIGAREALAHAGIQDLNNVAFISSTSVGGMCNSELHYPEFLTNNPYPDFIKIHAPAASTLAIAKELGFTGFTDTLSTACSSSANAIILACKLIKSGICDIAVAGGTDALAMFTLNGFSTLMISDKEWCKPFDANRAGLNLGEGAAYLVLETEESAKKRNTAILGKISGYANSNDAFHQTASSPEGTGASIAMGKTLEMAGLAPSDVDCINAHGTATPNNDLSESTAIQNIFGNNWPLFSSTKAYTGHTLAACGAIEAVYSILGLQNQIVFPNLNFSAPIEEFAKKPVTHVMQGVEIKNVISNSFGFGGNCSSVLFAKYN